MKHSIYSSTLVRKKALSIFTGASGEATKCSPDFNLTDCFCSQHVPLTAQRLPYLSPLLELFHHFMILTSEQVVLQPLQLLSQLLHSENTMRVGGGGERNINTHSR